MPADFMTMAKFCCVLDSFKAKLGILFSKFGVSGENRTAFVRTAKSLPRPRNMVVVDLKDLESVATGQNLISLLRARYESVRLNIR